MYLWLKCFLLKFIWLEGNIVTVSDDQSLQSLKTDQFSFKKKVGTPLLDVLLLPNIHVDLQSENNHESQVRA